MGQRCTVAYPWREGNRLWVWHDGDTFYPRLLSLIETAQNHIFVELYWFASGRVGRQFMVALLAAVARGVQVYCLFDDVGSQALTWADRACLQAGGVHVLFYNPLRARAVFANFRRNHRKLFIVDACAFLGGAGVADEFARSFGEQRWRDVLFEIQGPLVNDCVDHFFDSWLSCSGVPIELDQSETRPLENARWVPDVGGHAERERNGDARPIASVRARLVVGRGARRQPVARSCLTRIRKAKREIWLFTGYFYPNWKWRRALRQAVKRGVLVKLLLPGPYSDHPILAEAGRYYYRYLLHHGVEIHEYQPRFQHMKLLLCDDWVSFGSSNQDRWSQRWNLEANVEAEGAELAIRIKEEFTSDFGEAKRITSAEWSQRKWWRRVWTYVLYRISLSFEAWLSRRK